MHRNKLLFSEERCNLYMLLTCAKNRNLSLDFELLYINHKKTVFINLHTKDDQLTEKCLHPVHTFGVWKLSTTKVQGQLKPIILLKKFLKYNA